MSNTPTEPALFISYRIADALDLVTGLDRELTREFGAAAVFRDKTRLEGGQLWAAELERNAKGCRVMLVVIGPTWQTAADQEGDWKGIPRLLNPEDWVRKEITFALDAGAVIIPIYANGAQMPPKAWLQRCGLERLDGLQGEKLGALYHDADLEKLIALLRKRCPELASTEAEAKPQIVTSSQTRAVPRAPALYAAPAYTLTTKFVGRKAELRALDAWAKSDDTVLVVEAIGGEGKSALTWEWLNKKAEEKIPDLAGRMWWSFYERGTSMGWFVKCALAYTRGVDVESLKEFSHHECCEQLLVELRCRPFLLVLDGFERVLAAYHRIDKAQVSDDGIPIDQRECTSPRDGELLRELVQCGPSKILITSRLMPKGLEDAASQEPIPGVKHINLAGLSEDDALELVHTVGVKGDDAEILKFAGTFGRHALVLRIVCGMVTKYRPAPGDFDKWHADTLAGASVNLADLDVKQRKTHILQIAFDGLGEKTRLLLSRIAALSDAADYETVAALNTFLPPRPEPVEAPDRDNDGSYLRRRLERAKTPEEKASAEDALQRYREEVEPAHLEAQKAFEEYQRAVEAYPKRPEYLQGVKDFRAALEELTERGLLQWDRTDNTYDLHPVVRAYSFSRLDERDRTSAFDAILDHFSSRPQDDYDTATELHHVRNSIEMMRALVGAGRYEEAVNFYEGSFSETLIYSIGAYGPLIELLRPLVTDQRKAVHGLDDFAVISVTTDLALSMCKVGQNWEAGPLFSNSMYFSLRSAQPDWLATVLSGYALWHLSPLNQVAAAARSQALAAELFETTDYEDGITASLLDTLERTTRQGRFEEAERIVPILERRGQPRRSMSEPGEYECRLAHLRFEQGCLIDHELVKAMEVATFGHSLRKQLWTIALRAEWELTRGNSQAALDAIDNALTITRRTGAPAPSYVAIRALALARLKRTKAAREALAEVVDQTSSQYVAEAWLALGEREKAREAIHKAYKWAWADGPPHIHWYALKRCREIMAELGEPEPTLPPFDPSKVEPIPYEAEIRAVIERLKAEKAAKDAEKAAKVKPPTASNDDSEAP